MFLLHERHQGTSYSSEKLKLCYLFVYIAHFVSKTMTSVHTSLLA